MRLPESPRARRRLIVTACLALPLVVVIALFALIPSHGPSAPGPKGNEGPAQLATDTKVKLTAADRRAIDTALDRFLPAAMERKDPAEAWALAGPEFKAGSTLADWRRGNTPVPYYLARETTFHKWQLIESEKGSVIFNLLVHPAKGFQLSPYVFSGEVVKSHGRWLVNRLYTIAIMNKPTKTNQHPEVGPADFSGVGGGASTDPAKSSHKRRILPIVAVIGLVILIPLTLAAIALVRALRWRRKTRRAGGDQVPSLPSRYKA
jgi:hypothetical protein